MPNKPPYKVVFEVSAEGVEVHASGELSAGLAMELVGLMESFKASLLREVENQGRINGNFVSTNQHDKSN